MSHDLWRYYGSIHELEKKRTIASTRKAKLEAYTLTLGYYYGKQPVTELSKKFGVNRRTIQRDIKEIEEKRKAEKEALFDKLDEIEEKMKKGKLK